MGVEANPSNSWTLGGYISHNEALRSAGDALEAEREKHNLALHEADLRFREERDRRYNEVNIEKEKALKIKETADLAALQLARDIQIYKDEKANELREQINRERGLYASKSDVEAAVSKIDVTIRPVLDYVAGQQQGSKSVQDFTYNVYLFAAILAIAAGLIGHFVK